MNAELRARYLLSDWDITVKYGDEHDENLGDSDVRPEWREAIIRLHMTEIVEGRDGAGAHLPAIQAKNTEDVHYGTLRSEYFEHLLVGWRNSL